MGQNQAYWEAERQITKAQRESKIKLDLSNLELSTLPESIGNLSQLQTLYLEGNQLTTLPESVGNLVELRLLELGSNRLTTLPESIGNLSQLQTLDLDSNQLTTLPKSIGNLSQLQTLDLGSNKLTILPEWMDTLIQLKTLNLNGNQLTTLPTWMGHFTQLQSLYLGSNHLMALPRWISRLRKLQTLNLNSNQLKLLPKWISNLRKLQTLSLSSNYLTTLPELVDSLTRLQTLNLEGNQLKTLPESIVHLRRLQKLYLNGNQLTILPNSIGNLPQLQILNLSGNQLIALPKSVGNLIDLQRLNLNSNQLKTLPFSLGYLSELQKLYLNNNPLNSELLAAYGQGIDVFKTYLRSQAEKIVVNEVTIDDPHLFRSGYTLPVFACASAIAALRHLYQIQDFQTVTVDLINPQQIVEIPIEQVAKLGDGKALAITRSDPGDNLDLTRNTPVWALVEILPTGRFAANPQILLKGGDGIGIQLEAGGKDAIYDYAQQLLQKNLQQELRSQDRIVVTIILPEGRKLATRTSNSAFGVVEGLSLLGTTGISQPLSSPNQLDSYQKILTAKAQNFEELVFCVGENGLDLAQKFGFDSQQLIKTANWLGPMLVTAGVLGVKSIVLFGYHGKLIKLAGGIFHTHHHLADGRLEILTAYCSQFDIPSSTVKQVFNSPTTEAALQELRVLDTQKGTNWVPKIYGAIATKINRRCQDYIQKHSEQNVRVGSILFDRSRQIIIKRLKTDLECRECES